MSAIFTTPTSTLKKTPEIQQDANWHVICFSDSTSTDNPGRVRPTGSNEKTSRLRWRDYGFIINNEVINMRNQINRYIGGALAAMTLALGSVGTAQATILADVVWVVDTSGSMGGDINQVKNRILEFNTAMTDNGIDANYGLVRFGGTASLIQDITDFTTFSTSGSPFDKLSANGGGTEDGSAALQVALGASFRANSVQNFILVTDENDDTSSNRSLLNDDLAATTGVNELINVIGNPGDDDGNYYANLATNNGGNFFNILDFRNDPAPFFTNFVNTKVQEIINEGGGTPVPEPGTLALLSIGLTGLGFARKRKAA
ncbi:MAG: VWA domain-containing protein [Pseudomonadota bacterium]|nr:VWA domain-containing protein [Pseudomonadota bacterium]MDY6930153.1 VWA domain-containing protein [Pseudomonadota bacterium]